MSVVLMYRLLGTRRLAQDLLLSRVVARCFMKRGLFYAPCRRECSLLGNVNIGALRPTIAGTTSVDLSQGVDLSILLFFPPFQYSVVGFGKVASICVQYFDLVFPYTVETKEHDDILM